MLEDVTREARAIRKENRVLTTKIATLQAGIEIFTDEQAKQEMCLLYNDLKRWSFTQFRRTPSLGEGDDALEAEEKYDTFNLKVAQSEIAGMIYCSFWTTFSVGYGADWEEQFRKLDREIKKQCECPQEKPSNRALSNGIRYQPRRSSLERCDEHSHGIFRDSHSTS
jgi:hypothetical protein